MSFLTCVMAGQGTWLSAGCIAFSRYASMSRVTPHGQLLHASLARWLPLAAPH
ncbi:hypothetical protein [Cernens ardua]|uniref:hypothetical protein n=1 Tax=Cernens ardua TaxID=3402176 RepID=UPI003F967022